MDESTAAPVRRTSRAALALGLLLLFASVAGLLYYKWPGAWHKVQTVASTGVFTPRTVRFDPSAAPGWGRPLVQTANYFLIVWPALVFGLLIAGAVRAFVPGRWMVRLVGAGRVRGQVTAAVASAPLMLCSCCVAPVFTSLYERTRKLGPAITVMLGSPSLNLAALALTFVLFESRIALGRLAMALLAVLLVGPAVAHVAGRSARAVPPGVDDAEDPAPRSIADAVVRMGRETGRVALRTVPPIAAGVLLSACLLNAIDPAGIASGAGRAAAIAATAAVAIPLALPTFFEIPLALGMAHLGLPAGAIAAFLFAGPAVNLPSLLTLGREVSWQVAVLTGVLTFGIAMGIGLLVG